MKLIPLTQGKFAKVDDADFDFLNQWRWGASIRPSGKAYAVRSQYLKGDTKLHRKVLRLKMHRVIMQTPHGMATDHIDGDGLNNQRSNLRVCTNSENQWNRGPRAGYTIKGICWHKGHSMFSAHISINGKQKHLGYFKTKIEAAFAYNVAAIEKFGSFARINKI